MFLTGPSKLLQSEIDSANELGSRLLFVADYRQAFEAYRRLYERMLGAQNDLGEHRLHKGLPLANMGFARHRGDLVEEGARWTSMAFIEDCLSRAEESPRILDELSRPAAENLRLLGAADSELVDLAKSIRASVAEGVLIQDPAETYRQLRFGERIRAWLRLHRREERVRVFVSSPGDLRHERRMVAEACRELSLTIGAQVEALLWEGGGSLNPECQPFPPEITGLGPQAVIDEHLWSRLGGYDIYIGLLWRRMGTRTNGWRSGTEAEFRFAMDRHCRAGSPTDILFYEKRVADRNAVHPDARDFLAELHHLGLVDPFSSREAFRRMVFSHLVALVHEHTGRG